MRNNISVTVITVVYNGDRYIKGCLDSVSAQTLSDYEHLIIDGGSTDDTLHIISQHADPNRVVLSEPDSGLYDAMNKGLKLARGKYVAILNCDDIFLDKNTLSRVVDTFESNEFADIVIGSIEYYRHPNFTDIVRRWQVCSDTIASFTSGWHPPHPGFFAKKVCYDRGGGFDCSLAISADFDLMLRFIEVLGYSFVVAPFYTTKVADDGISASWRSRVLGNINILRSFKKYGVRVNPLFYLVRRLGPKIIGAFRQKFS
jgi:glycosyltransferase involved in cell wall biosynthesis